MCVDLNLYKYSVENFEIKAARRERKHCFLFQSGIFVLFFMIIESTAANLAERRICLHVQNESFQISNKS